MAAVGGVSGSVGVSSTTSRVVDGSNAQPSAIGSANTLHQHNTRHQSRVGGMLSSLGGPMPPPLSAWESRAQTPSNTFGTSQSLSPLNTSASANANRMPFSHGLNGGAVNQNGNTSTPIMQSHQNSGGNDNGQVNDNRSNGVFGGGIFGGESAGDIDQGRRKTPELNASRDSQRQSPAFTTETRGVPLAVPLKYKDSPEFRAVHNEIPDVAPDDRFPCLDYEFAKLRKADTASLQEHRELIDQLGNQRDALRELVKRESRLVSNLQESRATAASNVRELEDELLLKQRQINDQQNELRVLDSQIERMKRQPNADGIELESMWHQQLQESRDALFALRKHVENIEEDAVKESNRVSSGINGLRSELQTAKGDRLSILRDYEEAMRGNQEYVEVIDELKRQLRKANSKLSERGGVRFEDESRPGSRTEQYWDCGGDHNDFRAESRNGGAYPDRDERSSDYPLDRPLRSPTPNDEMARALLMLAENQQQASLNSALHSVKTYAGTIAATDSTIEEFFDEFDLVTKSCDDQQKLTILKLRFVQQAKLAFESLTSAEKSSYAMVRKSMISKMKNDGFGMGQKAYADFQTMFQEPDEPEEQFAMRLDETAARFFRNCDMPIESQLQMKKMTFINGLRNETQRTRLSDEATENKGYAEIVRKATMFARNYQGMQEASVKLGILQSRFGQGGSREPSSTSRTTVNSESSNNRLRNDRPLNGGGSQRTRPYCTYCQRDGHMFETCYRRFGTDQGNNQQRSQNGRGSSNYNSNANGPANDVRRSQQTPPPRYQQNFQQSNNANNQQRRPNEFGRSNAVQTMVVDAEHDPLEYVLSKECSPYSPRFPDDYVNTVLCGSVGAVLPAEGKGHSPSVIPVISEVSARPLSKLGRVVSEEFWFYGEPIVGLLDTGSAVSLIGIGCVGYLCKKIGLTESQIKLKVVNGTYSLKTVNDQQLPLYATVELLVHYGNGSLLCPRPGPPTKVVFHVIDGHMGFNILIGTNAMEALGFQLHDKRKNRVVPLSLRDTLGSVSPLETLIPVKGREVTEIFQINGQDIVGLIDTGAVASLISISCLKFLLTTTACFQEKLQMTAVGGKSVLASINKQWIPIFATVEFLLHYGDGPPVMVLLHAVDAEMGIDLILGTNVLDALGFEFHDTRKNRLMPFGKIPMANGASQQGESSNITTIVAAPITSPLSVFAVTVQRRTTIPARTTGVMRLKVDDQSMKREGAFLFEPNLRELGVEESANTTSLCSPFGIVSFNDNGTFTVFLENHTMECVVIEEGTPIGTLEATATILNACDLMTSKVTESIVTELKVNAVSLESSSDLERNEQLLQAIDFSKCDLDAGQLKSLQDLIIRFAHVFALTDSELSQTDLVSHHIDTGDARPIKQAARPLPYALREKAMQIVRDLCERGLARPSHSPWASPLHMVPKKDGEIRFCVDYRKLNGVTKKDGYPMPNIDAMLHTLDRKLFFSTMDLCSGYWQVRMDSDSIEKTAFAAPNGHYEFTVMSFGLCNAVATFERFMERLLDGINGDFAQAYLDDLMVASKTFDEHLQHLQQCFERLEWAGLRLKPKKCKFGVREVQFLGHIVGADGIRMDPEKVRAIKEYPRPHNVGEVRKFLGLSSYHRKFILNFAKKAFPITQLLKTDGFHWGRQEESAFEELKHALSTAPVLSLPDFAAAASGSRPFVIQTDACKTGIAAILSQADEKSQLHPIYYASRSCSDAEKNYPITELEGLAIKFGVEKFASFITRMPTIVYTDHSALVSMFKEMSNNPRVERWRLKLSGFDLTIVHRSGKSNINADVLSRAYEGVSLGSEHVVFGSGPQPKDEVLILGLVAAVQVQPVPANVLKSDDLEEWKSLICTDDDYEAIVNYLREHQVPDCVENAKAVVAEAGNYAFCDDLLYFVDQETGELRLAVPLSKRRPLVHERHGGLFGGHFNEKKIYLMLKKHYYWPRMRSQVRQWVLSCEICAHNRAGRRNTPPLKTIDSSAPFELLCMDLVKMGMTSRGNMYVATFIDHFTKYLWTAAIPNKEAETVARVLMKDIILIHGAPKQILTDRGREYINELMNTIGDVLQIDQRRTAGYNPRCNGACEGVNKTISGRLRRSVCNPREWDERLPYVTFAYNITPHESTGEAPYFLISGRDTRFPSSLDPRKQISKYQIDVDDFKTELLTGVQEVTEQVKCALDAARKRQKEYYDKNNKVQPSKFAVGDRVMVYSPLAVQRAKYPKLIWPYFGPYRILQLTQSDALVRPVDRPEAEADFVPLDRLCPVPKELPDFAYTGELRKRVKRVLHADKPPGGDLAVIGGEGGHRYNLRSKRNEETVATITESPFVPRPVEDFCSSRLAEFCAQKELHHLNPWLSLSSFCLAKNDRKSCDIEEEIGVDVLIASVFGAKVAMELDNLSSFQTMDLQAMEGVFLTSDDPD
jgi:hypothetical protein